MAESLTKGKSIFIYCDSASHTGRRVAITNFARTPAGLFGPQGWTERPASRAGETAGTGYTLHGASVDRSGWALGEADGGLRVDFDLVCRKCRKPWTLGEETLFAALDILEARGVSEVSVVELAGIVQEQAGR